MELPRESFKRDSPCVYLVTNARSEWKLVKGQLQHPATVKTLWGRWRQTGLVDCSRQLLWHNSLSLEWICNHPSFGSHCCRCVCFASITTCLMHKHTHTEAQQMELHQNYRPSSYVVLIGWHHWVSITKWISETQLVQHSFCLHWMKNMICDTKPQTDLVGLQFTVHLLLWLVWARK